MGVPRRVVLTGALAGVLSGCVTPDARPPVESGATGSGTTAAGPEVTPGVAGPTVDDVTALFAARSAALLAGDLDAAVLPYDAASRDGVRRTDDRALTAGLAEWSVDGVSLAPDGTLATASLTTRVAGEGRAVRGTLRVGVLPAGAGYVLAAAEDPGTPAPWDLGAVEARPVEGGVLLAVAPEPDVPDEAVLRDLAADLGPATARVDAVWGPDWPRGTAVVVVPSVDLAARLADLDPALVTALDALAVGQDARLPDGGPAGVRVVVAAGQFAGLSRAGRSITLTHELVHVATRAGTSVQPATPEDRPLPRWLIEGYADHVARRDSGIDPARLASALLDAVAAGASPTVPADDAFTTTDAAALQVAYAAAWTLVTSAARRAGTPAVTAWYRALARAPEAGGVPAGVVADRLEAACQAALGRDWTGVQQDWAADVADGLRGWV